MAYLTDNLISIIARSNSLEKLKDALIQFLSRHSVIELLDECIDFSDVEVISCASKSYIHANGFQKLVIATANGCGPSIRLHRWIGPSKRSDIHDHSWSFASLVIKGSLRVEEFLEIEDNNRVDVHVVPNLEYKARGETPHTIFQSCSLSCSEERILESGSIHGLIAGRFHAVQSIEPEETVTLLFQSNHLLPCSRIVLPQGEILTNPYAVTRISNLNFINTLRDIRRSLSTKVP